MIAKILLSFALSICAFDRPTFANERPVQLSLKSRGVQNQSLTMSELTKISPPEKIKVWSPIENKQHTYEGISANRVFDQVWGKSWRSGDEILMTCLDGYQPSIPVARFLKHTSWIAFKRDDQSTFAVSAPKTGQVIPLGPFYLIWENIQDQEMKQEGENGWPYQLIAFDQIKFTEKFPKIAPIPNANQSAKDGFLAFRKYCLKCHAINGEGGNMGPELHAPVNVTQYFKEKWLKAWIANPASVRNNSKMPPPFYDLKDRKKIDQTVDQIISYLKALP
jgi:cytochrome c2